MNNAVILIPSRLAATRLPKKPLLKINNISLINHVYKIANSSIVGQSYVATGDKEIFDEVTKYGGNCILTQSDHKTGTDRIFEAFQKLENDVLMVLNCFPDSSQNSLPNAFRPENRLGGRMSALLNLHKIPIPASPHLRIITSFLLT